MTFFNLSIIDYAAEALCDAAQAEGLAQDPEWRACFASSSGRTTARRTKARKALAAFLALAAWPPCNE